MFVRMIGSPAGDYAYRRHHGSLMVVCSARTEADGKRWIHVSCSHPHKLPSWDDLMLVKETFIGRQRMAIQVLPPRSRHVNDHPYVLHLWCCLDGDPAPDFRIDGRI
jgi:hypothetical protein